MLDAAPAWPNSTAKPGNSTATQHKSNQPAKPDQQNHSSQ
jgi:hypothetical protein